MKKPSISEVARQNNSNRVSKFASSMVPAAPQVDTPQEEEVKSPALGTVPQPTGSLTEVIQKGETDFEQGRGTTFTVEQLRATALPNALPATKGATRKRTASNTLVMEDILGTKAPEEETFPKMTRIAEKHHELLRKIAYQERKPMNTILYNLLEVLDQTYQRNQQNDV